MSGGGTEDRGYFQVEAIWWLALWCVVMVAWMHLSVRARARLSLEAELGRALLAGQPSDLPWSALLQHSWGEPVRCRRSEIELLCTARGRRLRLWTEGPRWRCELEDRRGLLALHLEGQRWR